MNNARKALIYWCLFEFALLTAILVWVHYCCTADFYRVQAGITNTIFWVGLGYIYFLVIRNARNKTGQEKGLNVMLTLMWGGVATVLLLYAVFGSPETWDDRAPTRFAIGVAGFSLVALIQFLIHQRLRDS